MLHWAHASGKIKHEKHSPVIFTPLYKDVTKDNCGSSLYDLSLSETGTLLKLTRGRYNVLLRLWAKVTNINYALLYTRSFDTYFTYIISFNS